MAAAEALRRRLRRPSAAAEAALRTTGPPRDRAKAYVTTEDVASAAEQVMRERERMRDTEAEAALESMFV